ncbi:MAG TPA: hypothetical protein VFE47_27010 [Tepidisphaeraceae bacterium]|nr:hypothetical protein [Tepidisphaeraceae bacterium]
MRITILPLAIVALLVCQASAAEKEKLYLDAIDVQPKPIHQDHSVKYDYDIVYVRAHRAGDKHLEFYTEIARPVYMQPGADLMLLHPDGSEELLVSGGSGAVQDPVISFDGQWVYYSLFHDLTRGGQFEIPPGGADIYKLNLKTRKIVQLTRQIYTPNTGAAPNWSPDFRKPQKDDNGKTNWIGYGVYNTGPCLLPGGRIMFTSNRNAFRPPKHPGPTMQLFVMDDVDDAADAERNIHQIGFLNVAMALHPAVLTDGRVMYSTLEGQGLRSDIEWGLWAIHPDGTAWRPLVSAFRPGGGAPDAFHFQTQLSDGRIVVEQYYNQNNSGFGTYYVFPLQGEDSTDGYAMGPADPHDPRNPALREGRNDNGRPKTTHLAYSPRGIEALTPFAHGDDGPADHSVAGDKNSPSVGKFTHPSAAPDDNLLTIWSPGPTNHQYTYNPQLNGGICMIKGGKPVDEPGQMLLIKIDPNYNCQWPRAVVPYKRIYGIDEPVKLADIANDGRLSRELPEGTPYGIVGTSSLYKRESFPRGGVPKGSVTAAWVGDKNDNSIRNGYNGLELFNASDESTLNWMNQGADAGIYSNDEIYAIRILAMETATDRNRGPKGGKLFYNVGRERLRILGEIPVRKFDANGHEPLDPDGNPDTSFAAKIPADTPFTFQTLNKDGMVLNMAQTWHQVRPGEVRTNCGGCHAHSQQPTPFDKTVAGRPGYILFDLTRQTPLLTDMTHDESKARATGWKAHAQAGDDGLRFEPRVKNVEYFRDVRPILQRSCVACHTGKWETQMGMLVLDDETSVNVEGVGKVPTTYARLAADHGQKSKWGYKPMWNEGRWCFPNASRYVRMFQSRRSMLVWKILGRRTDGWSNDDHPTELTPGDPTTLQWHGKPLEPTHANLGKADLDYTGTIMPPPDAVAGTFVAPDKSRIKVEALSDEDHRTIIRWIDLGCPIDFDYDAAHPDAAGYGWMCDDTRPTLCITQPLADRNETLGRIVIGAADYYSGLDEKSLSVTASFDVDGIAAGQELVGGFKSVNPGVWELKLARPVTGLRDGTITVSVKDKAGNTSRLERKFSVVTTTADGSKFSR